jgi:prophage regulatory protein
MAEPQDRLLKLPQVMEIVGLGKTMIYRMIRAGEFPQPFKPGGYASRWSEAEVLAWRSKVDEERRQRAA